MVQTQHRGATHRLNIQGVVRDLPLFPVAPDLAIAVLNILGDVELCEAAARGLTEALQGLDYDCLVTAEAKSIPLAYAMARQTGKTHAVLRKQYKSYMGEALQSTSHSITTGHPQKLYLDAKDRPRIAGRRVVLVDDVISTGSTLSAMETLMTEAGAVVVARAAICTEGDADRWRDVVALAHLPLFPWPAAASTGDDHDAP
ncbi:MAG: phosphoribosyltransferase family protein [Acidithiobacillus sp.]